MIELAIRVAWTLASSAFSPVCVDGGSPQIQPAGDVGQVELDFGVEPEVWF
jgi:hypothetical protein